MDKFSPSLVKKATDMEFANAIADEKLISGGEERCDGRVGELHRWGLELHRCCFQVQRVSGRSGASEGKARIHATVRHSRESGNPAPSFISRRPADE
jgi:hypothetical protein